MHKLSQEFDSACVRAPKREAKEVQCGLDKKPYEYDVLGHHMKVAGVYKFVAPLPTVPVPVPEAECPICFEKLNVARTRTLSCGHVFHEGCVQRWFQYGRRICPTCRKENV
jgi:hypothetical protein